MSADTDLAVIGPAASEAASLATDALGLAGEPAPGFNLWAAEAGELGDLISRQAKAWKAPLVGGNGACGEIAMSPRRGRRRQRPRRAAALTRGRRPGGGLRGRPHRRDAEAESRSPDRTAAPDSGRWPCPCCPTANGRAARRHDLAGQRSGRRTAPPRSPAGVGGNPRSIAALGDVQMTVSVELGRTKIPIRDLLGIHNGAVVQLDRAGSHPVDILSTGR